MPLKFALNFFYSSPFAKFSLPDQYPIFYIISCEKFLLYKKALYKAVRQEISKFSFWIHDNLANGRFALHWLKIRSDDRKGLI